MLENKRIKKAINWLISQGLFSSQKEIGEKIGITNRSYLSQLVNATPPNTDFVNKFIKIAPQINKDWLLYGEGEMLKPKRQEEDINAEMLGRAFRASNLDEGVINVRFFSVTPTATFQEFCDSNLEYPENIPIIAPKGEQIDDSSCVFEIQGESMLPMIPDKARILCHEIPPTRWHHISGVIVIAYRDKFVIKRVIENKLGNNDYIIIASDNPEYPGTETVCRADIRCIFQARHVLSYPIQ